MSPVANLGKQLCMFYNNNNKETHQYENRIISLRFSKLAAVRYLEFTKFRVYGTCHGSIALSPWYSTAIKFHV